MNIIRKEAALAGRQLILETGSFSYFHCFWISQARHRLFAFNG